MLSVLSNHDLMFAKWSGIFACSFVRSWQCWKHSVALDRSCHRVMTLVLLIFLSATVALAPRDGVPMYSELSLAKQSNEKMHLLHLVFHQDTER